MSLTVKDGVALVALPRLLDAANLKELGGQIRYAVRSAQIRALVLHGQGGLFCAGLSLSAQDHDPAPLRALVRQIEEAGKPVVAAINGAALGAGLELALAAAFRVAAPDARLALPQIKLGLPPSGGALWHLPRLVGAQNALNMILSGRPLRAHVAPPGLIDVIDADPIQAAEVLALSDDTPPRQTEPKDAGAFIQAIQASRAHGATSELRRRTIDCIEAALLLPREGADEMARAAWEDCQASTSSRALRHLARAEAAITPPPGARAPKRVAVVGGTRAAARVATDALMAGCDVALVGLDEAGLAVAAEDVVARLEAAVQLNRLGDAARDAHLRRLDLVSDLEKMPDVEMIIEAGPDDHQLRPTLLDALASLSQPGTVLATSATKGRIGELATEMARREDLIGFHLPRQSRKLAEITPHDQTGDPALHACQALADKMGRFGLVAGDVTGRIVARLLASSTRAIRAMGDSGAQPDEVNAALARFGISAFPDAGRRRGADDVALAQRWIANLAGTGARMIEEGATQRPGDLDVAAIYALDMARSSGGPMLAADLIGLVKVQNILRGADQTPPELIGKLIKNGQTFSDL